MTDEMPKIIIKPDTKPDCSKRVEKVFEKIGMEGVPKRLVKIRKEQLLNHSNCKYICSAFEGLFGMIGQMDNQENRLRIAQYKEELIYLHTPIYVGLPMYPQYTFGEEAWKEWNLWDLYSNYILLCNEKGWEDFYSVHDMIIFKKYHVLDMLNDLLVHEKIYGYDACAFTSGGEDLLNDFKEDMKIPVRIIQ